MSKITAHSITTRNFLSTGNVPQTIDLKTNLLTLILGLNVDSDAGMRNGAGKTTILQAICYAIFGKPLTRIKLSNLPNNINSKAMSVAFVFEKAGTMYRIERGQKPAFMRFFVNDVELKQEAGTDEALGENKFTQAEILRIFNMSHLLFKHIVALNTFTEPFLKETDSKQREIVEELLGVTQISQRAETLRSQMVETKDRIRDQEAHIKATTATNSRIEIALRSAETTERNWNRTRDTTIRQLNDEISALAEIDFDAELAAFDALDRHAETARIAQSTLTFAVQQHAQVQKQVDSLRKEANRYQQAANSLDEASHTRLDAEAKRKQADVTRAEKQVAQHLSEKAQIEIDLEADHRACVCCGQDINGTEHLKVVQENLSKQKSALEHRLGQLHTEIEDRNQEILAIDREKQAAVQSSVAQKEQLRKQHDHAISEIANLETAAADHARCVQEASANLTRLGQAPETVFDSRADVYAAREMRNTLDRDLEAETAKHNPYTEQVATLRGTLQKIDYSAINQHTVLMKHQDFLLKLLTSKDSFVRKRIVEQNLPYLNGRLSHYLEKLALPHSVMFQSDLSVEIMHLGRDYDFEQLSRGEMNRVIMATSWAFRDVWEGLNHTFNLLFVDELLDQGTDTQGVEAALSILKSMSRDRGKNVFLISHRDDLKARIDSVLLVRKTNEFTEFTENATL